MHRIIGLTGGFVLLVLVVATAATASFPGKNGKIVFQTNRYGNNDHEIYTSNADGTNRVNLTRNAAKDSFPHWSADGRRVVFTSNRDGNDEVFTMNDTGGDVRQLTFTTVVNNRWPSWTRDGRILFQQVTPGSARDVLLRLLDDSDLGVRAAAAWALSRISE